MFVLLKKKYFNENYHEKNAIGYKLGGRGGRGETKMRYKILKLECKLNKRKIANLIKN